MGRTRIDSLHLHFARGGVGGRRRDCRYAARREEVRRGHRRDRIRAYMKPLITGMFEAIDRLKALEDAEAAKSGSTPLDQILNGGAAVARRGCQTPTYSWCDSYDRTEGRRGGGALARLRHAAAPVAGVHPERLGLALDDDGRLLSSLCVLEVPRQNGKTGVCDPRETWGLVKRGEMDSRTPREEYQTAKKAFDRLRAKFGDCKNDPRARFPELNRLIDKYTTSANQMVLDLTQRRARRVPNPRQLHADGARRNVRPRGRGRGQDYTDEQDAALSPLNSAAPHGSPPDHPHGYRCPTPSASTRGRSSPACARWCANPPSAASACTSESPRFAGRRGRPRSVVRHEPLARIPIARERPAQRFQVDDGREKFAMEHLGWYPETIGKAERPINAAAWARAATAAPPQDGVRCSPSNSRRTARRMPVRGGPPGHRTRLRGGHTALHDGGGHHVARPLAVRAQGRCRADGHRRAGQRPEPPRPPHRRGRRVPARDTAAQDRRRRFGVLAHRERREGGRLGHFDQGPLNDAATQCTKRRIGTGGGWGFESADTADACVIESAALAYWGAMTTNRDQRRELLIAW
ncbi:MAG: hypothetical protein ACLTSX_00920 [Collinsella sp.]